MGFITWNEYKTDLFSLRTWILGLLWGFLVYAYTNQVEGGAQFLNTIGNIIFDILNFILLIPAKVGQLLGIKSATIAIITAILLVPLFEEIYEKLSKINPV